MRGPFGVAASCGILSLAALLPCLARGAPPAATPVAVRQPAAPRVDVGHLLPFDISLDSVTVDWARREVVCVVSVQGAMPAGAPQSRRVGCWLNYSDFPAGAFSPPSGGAYVYTEPSRRDEVGTRYRGNAAGTYKVRMRFATLANEVLAACQADADAAEKNKENNRRKAFSRRPGLPVQYILDVNATPVTNPPNHLKVLVRVTNPTAQLLSNLRLILVKNHLPLKEWKPLGMHPGGLAQVHVEDDMPGAGATNTYEAILTTDLTSSLPAPGTILDRRSGSYRRGGTIRGVP